MRSPSKNGEHDRRKAQRRGTSERRTDITRSLVGDRREMEQRRVGEAMVDALEDILKWERASERTLKAAAKTSTSDLRKN